MAAPVSMWKFNVKSLPLAPMGVNILYVSVFCALEDDIAPFDRLFKAKWVYCLGYINAFCSQIKNKIYPKKE